MRTPKQQLLLRQLQNLNGRFQVKIAALYDSLKISTEALYSSFLNLNNSFYSDSFQNPQRLLSESDLEVGIRLRIFNLKNDLFLTVNFSPFLNFLFRLCFAKIQIVLFYSQFVLYPFYNLLITVPVYLKKGTDSFFSHKNRFKLLRFNSCFMTFFGQIRIRNWIRTI